MTPDYSQTLDFALLTERVSALVQECDTARAEVKDAIALYMRAIQETLEARAIARRLAVWARIGAAWCASEAQPRAAADVAAFDAFDWAKEE